MSLIKLMRFAKSLRSGRDDVRAFQPAQDNLVPDFTRSGPRPDPVLEEPGRTGRARSGLGSDGANAPASGAGPFGKDASVNSANCDFKQGEMSLDGGAGAHSTAPERGAGIGRWSGRAGLPRPSLKADAKGQLSLEFVRVVRNDLSDSDLELVPTRLAVQPAGEPAAAGAVRGDAMEPECSRWSRFRARIFRAGPTG